MAEEITLTGTFEDIADAIREKGISGTMTATEMPGKIRQIAQIDPEDYYTKSETSSAAEISAGFDRLSGYYEKTETSSAAEISDAFANVSVDLSPYYTKSETSSAAEISDALEYAELDTKAAGAAADAAWQLADSARTKLAQDFAVTVLSGEYEGGETFEKYFWTYRPDWFTMTNNDSIPRNLVMKNVGDNLEYSTDGGSTWTAYANETTLAVAKGASVKFRHNGVSAWTPRRVNMQGSTGKWKASGNIMTLLDRTGAMTELTGGFEFSGFLSGVGVTDASRLRLAADSLGNSTYANMFNGCASLTAAPELPATNTSTYSYAYMFKGCTALERAPSPQAVTIAGGCCNYMFQGCTALKEAPALPALYVNAEGYASMFEGCTALTAAPELPANVLLKNAYKNMFKGCTSLKDAPKLTAPVYEDCYNGMFQDCTSLTGAPELTATALPYYCYRSMFQGCTSLKDAPALPATTLDSSCYSSMFAGCTSLTVAPALPATKLASSCYANMFQGCTSLKDAPALPATTLGSSCYSYMFKDCTSLTGAPSELPATTLGAVCYDGMFQGCTSLKDAPALPATTLQAYCYRNMFKDCSSLSSVECGLTAWTANATGAWLSGVAADGEFKCPAALGTDETITRGADACPEGWTVVNV